MLTNDIIKRLKQTNVSVDAELTKERVKTLLGAATREQKRRIDELAGLKRTSINRVYATGNISAKIALAISQILELNPAWLTGESASQGEFTAANINAFLTAKGYEAVVPEEPAPPAKRKYTRKPKPEPIATEAPDEPEAAEPEPEPEPISEAAPVSGDAEITEDDAVLLLRSMFIRAQFSGDVKRRLQDAIGILIL
jgi:hypothetical protein